MNLTSITAPTLLFLANLLIPSVMDTDTSNTVLKPTHTQAQHLSFAVKWVDPDPRVMPKSKKKKSKKQRRKMCRKWQQRLEKIRQQQRAGYSLKRGETLRHKADKLKLDLYRYCKRSSRVR